MTPHEMTQQFVSVSNALIAVLDEESTALLEARVERVAALREEKESAAANYEAIIRALNSQAGLFANATPATRRTIMTMKDALDTAAVRNIRALRAALEMNRRLVKTIATSVDRQRISASGYTKTGAAYSAAASAKCGEVVPISLNETF